MNIAENTLTPKSASIQSDEYGMRAYVNSTRGRAQLEAECPKDIIQAVEAVWGSAPTVTEPTLPTPSQPDPSQQDVINAQVLVQLAKLGKVANT